jgi:hypothetical protein
MYWQLGYIYSLWKMPIIGHSVLLFYGLYAVIDQQILNDYSGAFVCSNDVMASPLQLCHFLSSLSPSQERCMQKCRNEHRWNGIGSTIQRIIK